jgi:hypothetical protein
MHRPSTKVRTFVAFRFIEQRGTARESPAPGNERSAIVEGTWSSCHGFAAEVIDYRSLIERSAI